MPRRRRSSLPSPAIYHVTTRGVERRPIVLDAIDADAWEARLLETADRYGWELDTWSLMPNHFHLLVLTWQPLLSDGMRRLNGMYAQRFNRRYGRSGHLFGSRFEAYVIETEEHLDAARLYVYENATRAGLVGWRWRGLNARGRRNRTPRAGSVSSSA